MYCQRISAACRTCSSASCRIAGVLFDYMHAHTTIPGADLAVVDFTRDGQPWLGILKLNYKNGYTHYTDLACTMTWPEVGGTGPVQHRLSFWIKPLHGAPLP